MKRSALSVLGLCLAVSVAPLAAQQGASSVTVIQPCRLLDSRELPGGAPLLNGFTYQIQARGACGIPETANAVLLTVAMTGATSAGHLTIWPSDLLQPAASTLNYNGYGAVSSAAFARLCAPPLIECSGVDLSFRLSSAPSHVILDVVGYTELLPE
jgi:hypothetical protein